MDTYTPIYENKITSTTVTLITLKIADNAACAPPATVVASALADQRYQVGAAVMSIQWPAFAYSTSPADQTCQLSYSAVVPSAIQAAVVINKTSRQLSVSTKLTTMIGTHAIVVSAVEPDGTAIATPTLTFNLLITAACDPPSSVAAPHPADAVGRLSGKSQTFTWGAWTSVTPSGCAFTYEVAVPAVLSEAVTVDTAARTVTLLSTKQSLAGTYTLTITALSSSGAAIASANTVKQPITLLAGSTTQDAVAATIQTVGVTAAVANLARNLVRSAGNSIVRGRGGGRPGQTSFDASVAQPGIVQGSGPGATSFDGPGGFDGATGGATGTKGGKGGRGSTTAGDFVDGVNTAAGSATSAAGDATGGATGGDANDASGDDSERGVNSFDFGLDNLEGQYGDLQL